MFLVHRQKKYSTSYKFKMDKKSYRIDMEVFREIFQICPRISNQDFDELSTDEDIMCQSWRTFPSIINKCLPRKISASPKMRRKLKKPASPSKNRTLVTEEEEEPNPLRKLYLLRNLLLKDSLLVFKSERLVVAQVREVIPNQRLLMSQKGDSRDGNEDDSNDNSNDNSNDDTNADDNNDDVNNVESDEDHEQANDEQTESNDEEEAKQDDEFVHTPNDYVPTDDETNDEYKEFDEEEYEELYGDVNISLKDAKTVEKEKGDMEMTNTETGDTELENVNREEVVSMLDIKVQYEVPRTSPLLTIPVSVIPEHTVVKPPKIVTTASSVTISSLLSSLFPYLQLLKPIPTPTTTHKTIDHSAAFLSAIKSKVPNAIKEYNGTSLDDALHKDKDAMDEGAADKLKKRKHDDADKDKGPFAGSDRGLKRQKIGRDTEPPKKTKLTKTSKGTSKKRPPQTWINKIAQVEKPPFSFDELMSTPLNFLAYVMNHLKIDKLTQEHLVRPTFNLLKGTCKNHVELEYNFKECYKALTDRLYWNNPEGKEYPFDLSKPLPLIMVQGRQVVPVDYFINNDLEYPRGGSSSKKYMTSTTKTRAAMYDILGIEDILPSLWSPIKWYDYGYLEEIEVQREGYFPKLHLHDIKDMLLLLVQKKLSNLERDVIFYLGVALCAKHFLVIDAHMHGAFLKSKTTKFSAADRHVSAANVDILMLLGFEQRMIPEPGDTNREVPANETFHVETNDELTKKELRQIEADDQDIQTILLGLPEDIYAAVDNSPHQDQPSFNQNYMQQPMPNPEDITDPTTAMNMALALMAKAFKLNYSTPTNNNQMISSNPCNRHIAQPGNANQIRNGNLVAARAEGNVAVHNGNHIRCTTAGEWVILLETTPSGQGEGMLPIFRHNLDEIEEVNANCILMANLQQASTSEEQYTELLEPIPESHQGPQNDNDVISEVTNVEQSGGTVEKHPVNVKETHFKSLAKEADESLAQHKALELEIERLLRAVETHNWSSFARQELHKIMEAAKFVGDFKSLAKEADESLAQHKALELEIERLLRAVVSQDIMSVVQKDYVEDTSTLQTKLERKNAL
nr:hypothetical protein [Tanacetum cinerariifolium]